MRRDLLTIQKGNDNPFAVLCTDCFVSILATCNISVLNVKTDEEESLLYLDIFESAVQTMKNVISAPILLGISSQ